MIVDIIHLPFNGQALDSYDVLLPLVNKRPYFPDDVYFLGHGTTIPIHEFFDRYKFIENFNGEMREHIVLSRYKLDLDSITSDNAIIYILTSRHHTAEGVINYKHLAQSRKVLNVLRTDNGNISSVQQVVIDAMFNKHPGVAHMSGMELYLSSFVAKYKNVIESLTTPSVKDTVSMLTNLNDIYHTLMSALSDMSIPDEEIDTYLYTTLGLPNATPINGFSKYIVDSGNRSIHMYNIASMTNTSSFGIYASTIPISTIDSSTGTVVYNKHIDAGANLINPTGTMEILSEIELCNHTDISIELPYTSATLPDVIVHYSGSVFNHYSMTAGSNLTVDIDIVKLYAVLKEEYGSRLFDNANNRPCIQICKTFGEEVYIRFINSDGSIHTVIYDLTLMGILAPSIIGDNNGLYISELMYN